MDGLRILVAPSGYRECLLADQVARAIASGARRACPHAQVKELPLVDGGEGFARALVRAGGGRLRAVHVTGPLGETREAEIGWLDEGPTAVIEMASVSGPRRAPPERSDPLRATSRGAGEMIRLALDRGARRILLGCGDSGTCDGGMGLAAALGFRFLDAEGEELPEGGGALARLARIDASRRDRRLDAVRLEVACSFCVTLGDAARRVAPRKGASAEAVERLEAGLRRLAAVLERSGAGAGLEAMPGGGASGGLGASLAALLGGRLLPWQEVAMARLQLDRHIAQSDLVVTAEGSLDDGAGLGKIPAEVARRARQAGVPVIALAGMAGRGARALHEEGVTAFFSSPPVTAGREEATLRAAGDLELCAEQALRAVFLGRRLAQKRVAGPGA